MKSLRVLVIAAVVAVGGPAVAATRVAVGPFDGDRTGDLQDIVIELLATDYRVLPSRDVTRAIDKLGMDDLDTKKSLAKLGLELDADAVIVGEVEPDGNKQKLTLLVYVAKKKSAFRMTARFTSPRQVRDSALRDELRNTLGPGGGGGVSGARGGDDDTGTSSGRKGKRTLAGDDDRDSGTRRGGDDDRGDDRDRGDDDTGTSSGRKGKRTGRAGDDDRDDRRDDGDDRRDDGDDRRDDGDDDDRDSGKRRGGDDGDDDDDDDDDRGSSRTVVRTARKAAVRLEVGVSGTGRQLSFITNLDAEQAPPGYKSNLVPGARFHGELYPLALQNPDSPAAGLGIAADFDRAIGLSTTSSLAPMTPLTTTSQFYAVGVRYRIAIGNRVLNPSFILGVGYGVRQFTVDRAPLMGMTLDLPDVKYTYIDPMIGARIPIHPSAALSVSGRFLAMRDSGPIGKNDSYGQAKITGIDIEGGFEFLLGRYVLIHISGVFTQLGYTFKGGAVETNGRDGDINTLDVGGARDRYFGAMGTVGVVY